MSNGLFAENALGALTIASAQQLISQGKLDCQTLVQSYIKRAEDRSSLNTFITLDVEGAVALAKKQDDVWGRGENLKPLSGVPLVVKDNIHVMGMPATAGTRALSTFVPKADAPVVARLRQAGAIMLGKTNMHELAYGATGYNYAFHEPGQVGVRNAYDPTRIAGGSSSGSAVALGARMALGALGTDTGGSMRIPCALNGCSSLRPSWGRYSGLGVIPISQSRDTIGPMALSMADVALIDGVISGQHGLMPIQTDRLRLGVVPGFWANLDSDTQTISSKAVGLLEKSGVQFVEVPEARFIQMNEAIGFPVVIYESYQDMVDYLRDQGPGISIEELFKEITSPDVKSIYENMVLARKTMGPNGQLVDALPPYRDAIEVGRPALKRHYRELFAKYNLDAFVFPTTPIVAPLATEEILLPENFLLLIQNTEPAASAGLASIQLPIGIGPMTNMPIGLELDGPEGSDRRLLSIGICLEMILGRIPGAI